MTNVVVLCTVVDPADRGVVGVHDGPLTRARVAHGLEAGNDHPGGHAAGAASTVPDLG